jgi:hypothetical protein
LYEERDSLSQSASDGRVGIQSSADIAVGSAMTWGERRGRDVCSLAANA